MKKLNLQLGSIKEMLSKEQMKNIVGGGECWEDYTSSAFCYYYTPADPEVPPGDEEHVYSCSLDYEYCPSTEGNTATSDCRSMTEYHMPFNASMGSCFTGRHG